jgi:predicted RND superfamily exporter protein
MMFSHIGQRNIRSMLLGTLVALVLISGVLLVMLRSVKLGLVSLAPNLFPPLVGFGLWGLIDGQVTLALSLVSSMTLGIIIDDTVHFLVKYQRTRQVDGLDPESAVRRTYGEVGPAMFFTSIILMAGFLVLSLSHFALNSGMGLLTAIVIGIALLLDLLFLSPLLLFVEETPDALVAATADRPAGS